MAQQKETAPKKSSESTTSGAPEVEQTVAHDAPEMPGKLMPLVVIGKALIQAAEGKGMPVVTLAINAALRDVTYEEAVELVGQLDRMRKAADRAHGIAQEIVMQRS